MNTTSNIILNKEQIKRKVERIAYQIYENNCEENQIYLIGITDVGSIIARKLKEHLTEISEIEVFFNTISLKEPQNPENEPKKLKNKVFVLVDDVANTGKTLCYNIQPLLNYSPKKIEIAVLVDRQYKQFPVVPNYVGFSLATTLHDYVVVDIQKGDTDDVVYLK